MKRIVTVVAVLVVGFILLPCTSSAQSKEDGRRLFDEARTLKDKARSKEDLKRVIQKYGEALTIFRKIGDVEFEAATLNNMGIVYRMWGQYSKSLEHYEKSLELKRKIGDARGQENALNEMGLVYGALGQYTKSIECHEKSLGIAREQGDRVGQGYALGNLGNLCWARGQYSNAVGHYKKCLEIFREARDLRGEAYALNGLGVVYASWGKYSNAVEHYEKSLELKRKTNEVMGEARTLCNLGNVYSNWGQYHKAAQYYQRCLDLRRLMGDVPGEASTLGNLGMIYQAWGEYEKALAKFREALEIRTKIGVPAGRQISNIGNLYLDMGEISKAKPFVQKSKSYALLGRLSLVKGDYPSAKKCYESLFKYAEQNRNASILFTAHTGLGATYEGMRDNSKAAEYYLKAVEFIEDLRSGLNAAERENFFDVRISGFYRTAPYEGLARVLLKMNRPLDALKQSEYTKARIFAEAISKRNETASLDVPKGIRDKDSLLDDQLSALTKNLQQAYEKGNKEVIRVLEPQVKQAKQDLAAHVDMLRKRYPLFAATRYPQPMDLDETALQNNEWALAYHVTEPGLIVYVTKGKQLVKALFKPVQRKEIDSLVRKFRYPLEMNPRDGPKGIMEKLKKFDFSTGRQLRDLLLSDVLSVLPKNSPIMVVPDGSLGLLPFEALPLKSGARIAVDKKIPYVKAAEFFGDRNPLCYCQSVTALTLARTLGKQKKPVQRLLVIADPVFQMKEARAQQGTRQTVRQAGAEARLYQNLMAAMEEGKLGNLRFNRLPLAGKLAEDLKGLYVGASEVYTGLDASKQRFLGKLAPELGGYDKIVFATHGYFGKDLPGIKEPVLVLTLVPPGTDGLLRMSEVAGLKMNAAVVALTACQSGLGRNISGEGTMGMGRAFQYAGARSVLMSLWSVAEKSSVQLVESFFKHIKEGKGKLEALRAARTEIRKAGFDHPFFWAPFILVGEVN